MRTRRKKMIAVDFLQRYSWWITTQIENKICSGRIGVWPSVVSRQIERRLILDIADAGVGPVRQQQIDDGRVTVLSGAV